RLIGAKVMAKPLRQLPYETVGDLLLRFPDTPSVENYQRDLDLDTALATVRYTAGGLSFLRESFSSPVDQVIVVRLTASRKGSISFSATMKSPQKAMLKTGPENTLVLHGTNGTAEGIAGALTFEARVQVLAEGGQTSSTPETISVRNADSALLLIAAATSYKSFKDVNG